MRLGSTDKRYTSIIQLAQFYILLTVHHVLILGK